MYDPDIAETLEGTEIAIVGMACRFPGAADIDAFWRNLAAGQESITFFDEADIDTTGMDPALLNAPNYVKAAPVLDDIERFDAAFFGYSPREAEVMDPQHRLFLEEAWHALEHAGYDPDRYQGAIGVFAGARTNTYLLGLATNRAVVDSIGAFEIGLGNDLAFLPTRVSYKLNLRGPSYAVHTACSTALVAVHLACQSLLLGECQMALAGGVALNVPHNTGYFYQTGGIVSPDGHCRAFDVDAQGTLFGSGVGVVTLKRLETALEDGDTIYAVIRGTATNNDGANKASFTAPSIQGQTDVLLEALAAANVDPDSIGYIEAHGTGTALGDSIEVRALSRAFRAATQRRAFCALGSVKTNFGHLDAAAGIAGLLKSVLALHHREIPPTLHFTQVNPNVALPNSPFYINTVLQPWEAREDAPRRAGVSAFGVGGTNAHAVLEESPVPLARAASRAWHVLPISAKTPAALDATATQLAEFFRATPDVRLDDAAFTLQVGRGRFAQRRAVIARTPAEAATLLESNDPGSVVSGVQTTQNRSVVFMFPGSGAQHIGMGQGMYHQQAVFRDVVDECLDYLSTIAPEESWRTWLYPDASDADRAQQVIERPAIAQPLIFTIEYALAKFWESCGVRPTMMIGHSLGEYTAACLAGVLSLSDMLTLVLRRGQLIEQTEAGAMLSIRQSATAIEAYLTGTLTLAAINAPTYCTVAGSKADVAALEARLEQARIETRRLHIEMAAHSSLLDPILAEYEAVVRALPLAVPTARVISNLSGTWLTEAEATDPAYWVRHLRQPVRFSDGIATLYAEDPSALFVEVGPGNSLSTLVKQQQMGYDSGHVLASLPHARDSRPDDAFCLTTLARLWTLDVDIAWDGLWNTQPSMRIALPTYPFERQRYWIAPQMGGDQTRSTAMMGKSPRLSSWFATPAWEAVAALPAVVFDTPRPWLVFQDSVGIGAALVTQLQAAGQQVVTVTPATEYRVLDQAHFTVTPGSAEDYQALLTHLHAQGQLPDVILHAWSTLPLEHTTDSDSFAEAQTWGYYSVLALAQAIAAVVPGHHAHIQIITQGAWDVSGAETMRPEFATLTGPLKVIPQEQGTLTCAWVDIASFSTHSRHQIRQADVLLREATTDTGDVLVAYRGGQRWNSTFRPVPLDATMPTERPIRERGVYLITGGLGGVGYLLGHYLAEHHQARLILTGRDPLPPREDWATVLADPTTPARVVTKIQNIQALEALGAEVMVAFADVADEVQMHALLEAIDARFGALHGVLHAAGVTYGESIYKPFTEIGAEASVTQFRPKAQGLYVLERVLGERVLDFVLCFSSNAAVLGGLGYVTYAAANAFMDAFVQARRGDSGIPWLSATWDPWPEETKHYQAVQTSMDQYTMTVAESQEAFRRLVNYAPEGSIVVATGDLWARYDLWVTQPARAANGQQAQHSRPALATHYAAPRDTLESQIADIWQQVLGIEQVGIQDNFFDLGGHSLLATRLVAQLKQTFQCELSLQAFFTAPTIADIARTIAAQRAPVEADTQADLLQMISQMSEAELALELEKRLAGEPS